MRLVSWRGSRSKIVIAASTALFVLAAILVPWPLEAAPASPRTLEVYARQFAFEPAAVQVNRGDTVTIHFQSLDAVHGMFVDGYDVDLHAEPGKSAQATFVADRPGKFTIRCSVSCGVLHPFMIGELDVAPDSPLWRAVAATVITAIGAVMFYWKGDSPKEPADE